MSFKKVILEKSKEMIKLLMVFT